MAITLGVEFDYKYLNKANVTSGNISGIVIKI